MRLRFAILAAGTVLAACGSSTANSSVTSGSSSSSSPAPAGAVTCGPASARTLAQNGEVRVYARSGSVYGCARGTSKSLLLGQSRTCIMHARVAPVAVAGRLAAYGSEMCGIDTGSSVVVIRRLTDGKRLARLPVITGQVGPESYETVTSVVVKRDGSVAWIATSSSIVRHSRLIEVHKRDRNGRALLDSGSGIGTSSLELHASQLSWTHGGTRRQATLS